MLKRIMAASMGTWLRRANREFFELDTGRAAHRPGAGHLTVRFCIEKLAPLGANDEGLLARFPVGDR